MIKDIGCIQFVIFFYWYQIIPKLHFYFDHDATNINSVIFKDSKSAQKGGPKTGPWTDRYYSLIPYKDGQLLRSGKSMCQNATFYEQWRHLHFPFAKSNYFPKNEEERRTKYEHDFGQSNLALSNVRALRAIMFPSLQCLLGGLPIIRPIHVFRIEVSIVLRLELGWATGAFRSDLRSGSWLVWEITQMTRFKWWIGAKERFS